MPPCKPIACFCLILLSAGDTCVAQTVIWQETFDGTGNWGTLNIPAGAEGCNANPFFISCQENGNAPGSCGTGCGTDKTLHTSSVAYGDVGAAYDAGGGSACGGLLACLFGGLCNTITDRRSSSATISTVGYTTLSLELDYIENGSGSADNAYSEYSTNNGSTWTTLLDMPKTNNAGCGGQGRWTHISIPLPASCENIATLRIAFHWVNNNDGAGTDPSFAVDDVQIMQPIPTPVELIAFGAHAAGRVVQLNWTTASERNNDHFTVERGFDGGSFNELGHVKGAGNSQQVLHYGFTDEDPREGMNYYRLRQVDFDGGWKLSEAVPLSFHSIHAPLDEATLVDGLLTTGMIEDPAACHFTLLDLQGRVLREGSPVTDRVRLDLRSMAPGVFLLRLRTLSGTAARKFVR